MKSKALIMLVCSLGISVVVTAQSKSDKEQITQVIATYFDGWASGDTVKLSKAMHPSCQLKSYRDGQFNQVDRAKYISYFQPHPREKDVKTKLIKMDITANIASVKTQISTDKYLFTDYLHLIKTNEGWFIVDKVAYRLDK